MSLAENDFEGIDFGKYVVLWCDECHCFHSEAAGHDQAEIDRFKEQK